MPRNLICKVTEERCDNPGCKIGWCLTERQERREALEREAAFRELVEANVRSALFKTRGTYPSDEEVRARASDPTVIELFRKNVSYRR